MRRARRAPRPPGPRSGRGRRYARPVTSVGSPRDAEPAGPADDGGSDRPRSNVAGLAEGAIPYTKHSSKRTRMLIAGAAVIGLGAVCAYTFLVDPNNPDNAYPKCPLKAFTGIDCPGCGGLRATNALLHGDVLGAADHNILALVLLPIMAFMFIRWVLAQFDITVPTIHWPRAFVWITPLVLVVFTVARNVPLPGIGWLSSGLS
jgi:hypothetical protein